MDTDFYFRLANGEIHTAPYDSGEYVMHVGKYRGWRLRDIPIGYLRWALKNLEYADHGTLCHHIYRYLQNIELNAKKQ